MEPSNQLRDRVLNRLIEDLVGPMGSDEVLTDRPSRRYSTGILYPRGSRITAEEDRDGGLAANEPEDAASEPDDSSVSLYATLKPSTAGLSFAIKPVRADAPPTVDIRVQCAVYRRFAVNDSGVEIDGEPPSRAQERWRRHQLEAVLSVDLREGAARFNLAEQGIDGLELYVLSTMHAGLSTVTAAISNRRERGKSSAFDEEQHFFQTELRIDRVDGGELAPRPSARAQTDEDSRTSALIYRNVREYVVGHTCSARAELTNEKPSALVTDWVPQTEVPPVSDQGDAVFKSLENGGELRPLSASWLAQVNANELKEGLASLVAAYNSWISSEEDRIEGLLEPLKPQARLHVERCREGAARMGSAVDLLHDDPEVRRAFQLAQEAMLLQFGWQNDGAALAWRPFQLGFQLLVLESLANRSHTERQIMDLLWFPTGGGKTEAYLALAAFVIILRRLRADGKDDGAGVAVLMRYTLRLLTIQQFQRAAAMIFACELLRRRSTNPASGLPNLGGRPIGIGLWVGGTATPLTIKEALNRKDGDPSTPEQLTTCPCCGSRLRWVKSPTSYEAQCPSDPSTCDLAATGPSLPVWTIDEEIYRETPSLLIGTVDKFAQIVRRLETGALFGLRTSHSPPDLVIQDELHLISGPLGSIAGLYETAIDELCSRGRIRPKIIGSTATIRRAEEQIRSLFNRGTYQFPSPGLDADNSGFAVTDRTKPGRTYVGLTTAGRSATYMLQALTASLLQSASAGEASDIERDYYWTLVGYFNSLRELGRALVLMQDDVPISIGQFAGRRDEVARSTNPPAELTSRRQTYEIRDMLEQLEIRWDQPSAVDLLLASNMISVGMNIPRLGLMVVNAQPKSLSEYIQATSRVGRNNVPGLVVTMYNSLRARDRSHYETFETWHRALYRDVEATSVTPFASRAQDKALHAVLVALARHTVPALSKKPLLSDIDRAALEEIAGRIEARVMDVDRDEHALVSHKLKLLMDEWESRRDLQAYWDDFGKQISLLISAEQYAALNDTDAPQEGVRRALWPTANSMREVEAGTPFVLRRALKVGDS